MLCRKQYQDCIHVDGIEDSLELSDLNGKNIADIETRGWSLEFLRRSGTAFYAVVSECERLSQQQRPVCSAVPCTKTFAEGSQHDGIVVVDEKGNWQAQSDLSSLLILNKRNKPKCARSITSLYP